MSLVSAKSGIWQAGLGWVWHCQRAEHPDSAEEIAIVVRRTKTNVCFMLNKYLLLCSSTGLGNKTIKKTAGFALGCHILFL